MDSRQRRSWVLPTPDGNIDKRDRYEIGIFYSFVKIIEEYTKPFRAIFDSLGMKPKVFMSKKGTNIFVSPRKTSKDV